MADDDEMDMKKGEESADSSSNSSSDEEMDSENSDTAKDSDDGSSSSDGIDLGEDHEETIKNYEIDLKKNPYLYDRHVQLIKIYRKLGRLDNLKEARERMHKSYPLSPKLWLRWLKDAQRDVETKEDREKVAALFKLACEDYQSVDVWLEYCAFAVGSMEQMGDKWVRSVFEEALSRVGGHISKGNQIWAAYQDFEMIRLAQIPKDPNVKKQEVVDEQCEVIAKMFRRQLSLPLRGMDEVMEEYKDWVQSVPPEVQSSFDRAKTYLSEVEDFIDAVEDADTDDERYKAYIAYIDFSERKGVPSRIISAFEEALTALCLRADLWMRYLNYRIKNFLTEDNIVPHCHRAVRNCPWSLDLWLLKAECLERFGKDNEAIQSTYESALQAGFTECQDFLRLWTDYIAYLRRTVDWSLSVEELRSSKQVETLRDTFERGIIHLEKYYGTFGDPQCSLFRFWAFVEAKFLKNMPKARELWSEVMKRNHGNEAHMWLEYIAFERAYGDTKHCRKVLARAINSVTDWPEHVFDACLRFEREEGSMETLIEVRTKVEQQRARLADRAAAASAKENATKKPAQAKAGKRGQKRPADTTAASSASAVSVTHTSSSDTAARPQKRTKQEEVPSQELVPTPSHNKDSEGFVVPTAPKQASPKSAPPPGYLAAKARKLAEKEKEEETAPEPKSGSHGTIVEHDESKEYRTVFVSNLDYKTKPSVIEEIFRECGDLNEVRLVRDHQGRSKGFAYVEFSSGAPIRAALEKDRTPVEGRPMFVSECNPTKRHGFQYGGGLEKNKLFVRNLPKTITQPALETMFKEYGNVTAVRIVTYRNGSPKGHAYVDFATEDAASRALVGLDGQLVGENQISVELSNPPKRKEPALGQPVAGFQEEALGSGKRLTSDHGRARTQVALVPRTLLKKPAGSGGDKQPKDGSSSSSVANVSSSNGAGDPLSIKKSAGLSNDEFRKMFLKK